MAIIALQLNKTTTNLQIVDGNNFLYSRLVVSTDINLIRKTLADIDQCAAPPIFVFDGYNNDARRRAIFPGYKIRTATTSAVRENIYHNMRLIKALMLMTKCVIIEVPTWEADDVIATLARSSDSKTEVIVVTADKDISQLGYLPNVTVASDPTKVLYFNVRLYKTLKGDPSDTIPGIPGFGDAAFRNCNKGEFKQMLNLSEWHPRFTAERLGVKESVAQWIELNFGLLKSYWQIIALMDVPEADINKSITVGHSDMAGINTVLDKYML